ncbi:hypothetical protein HN873_044641, partial [Arachis hypogaea]
TVTVGGGVVIAALPATSLLLQLVSVADESQESRKRKNSFEGGIQSQTVRNNVVVLEGESNFHESLHTNNKKQKEVNPLLNSNHSQHIETHLRHNYNQYYHQREIIFTNAIDKMTAGQQP